MIQSFRIEGFRGFDELTLPKLGNVNLVVARNNVGKTTVLEALSIYALREGAPTQAREVLEARDELAHDGRSSVESWARLFHQGAVERPIKLVSDRDVVTLELAWARWIGDELNRVRSYSVVPPSSDEETEYDRVLLASGEGFRRGLTVGRSRLLRRVRAMPPPALARLLRAHGLRDTDAASMWDLIALSEKEDDVLRALRLIDSSVERVSYVGEQGGRSRRVPFVRCKGRSAEPLKSMGDGMNRLFEIVLSLVTVQGGVLCVDELENGIHFGVQHDVWRVVFETAARLNVQVFAATHSWDCIEAFQRVASEHSSEGMLIRLERSPTGTRAFTFSESDLAIVTRNSIEVR